MAIAVVSKQSAPNATTETTLYTVPASTSTTFSVTITNRSNASVTYRLSKAVTGGATANKDYYAYDEAIPANASVQRTGLVAAATDIIRIYASTADLSFNLDGLEKT